MTPATLASTRHSAPDIAPDAPLYLSRIFLEARNRDVQSALNDPYQMHRLVSGAFGQGEDYDSARVLFRVDDDGKTPLHLLVQSLRRPDWNRFSREYSRGSAETKEWNPQFRDGQMLSFRLLANVCKREFLGRGVKGKRRGLYSEIEQLQWLARQGERCGFAFQPTERLWKRRDEDGATSETIVEVPNVSTLMIGRREQEAREGSRDARFTRLRARIEDTRGDHGGEPHDARFCAVRFDGVLHIADAAAFALALRGGIGPSKGLGFGLLSLARA